MKAAELCAGYGGLYMAMRLAGWPVDLAWLSEVDEDASKVLAAHHPGVPNLGDMTTADWERVEKVAVVAGGIPCQGWSLAGKRNGSQDERDLWPVRKFDADGNPRRGAVDMLRAVRPRVFVLENVASLVSAEKGVPFRTILTDLHGMGYNAGWVTVGACRVGACHHRHRVFLVATLAGVVPPEGSLFGVPLEAAGKWPTSGLMVGGQVWPLDVAVCGAPTSESNMLPTPTAKASEDSQTHRSGSRSNELLLTGFALAYAAGTLPPASTDRHGVAAQLLPTPTSDERRGRVTSPDVAAKRMESGRRNLEDAVALLPTPTVADSQRRSETYYRSNPTLVGALLPTPTARDAARGAGRTSPEGRPLSEVIALLPTPKASDAEKGGPNQRGSSGDFALPAAVQPGRFGVYERAVRRHERALGRLAPNPTEPGRNGKPRLAAPFVEFMQMLPAGHLTDHLPRKAAIARAGNGVNPVQGALALMILAPYMPDLVPACVEVAA